MERLDRISSLVWLVLSIFICVSSTRFSLGSLHDPGPGFFPFGAGVVMGILSVIVYIKATRKKSAEEKGWYSKEKWKKLVLILGILVGYAFFLEPLGFILSTFLLLFCLLKAVELQKWSVAIGGSALISIASYVLFDVWLKTQLPKGIWGF